MNILSLFDGMSCGQLALQRAGIQYDNYFASEIDKYAIKVAMKNFPNTIQLGSVTEVFARNLPKIDLLIGGSPCQGFSFAGKALAFDDPRSKLFFEYVRLLKETDPKFFLLENVSMKKEYENVITDLLGVSPITINSSLVSAQNRKRLYWTNIPEITQPEDKGIMLKDILEDGVSDREKGYCLDANYCSRRQLVFIPTTIHNSKNNLKFVGGFVSDNAPLWLNDGKTLQCNFRQGSRVYSCEGKAPTFSANNGGLGGKTGLYKIGESIRKLTPVECERLQTLPDNYTAGVSDTQRYKMIGNGWTVDVVSHILKHLNKIKTETTQIT